MISTLLAFLFALAVLIAIHEYGHFIVARLCGIKVLKFSIGFGKPLYTYQKNKQSTEYILAAIPLGGYVKMLDEREGEVKAEEKHLSFNIKSVWQRIAVVAAGPIFNFILAILLLWVMYIHGISGINPIVGSVNKGSIAEHAKLQVKDKFIEVNGRAVQTWSNVQMALLQGSFENDGLVQVTILDKHQDVITKRLDFADFPILKDEGDILTKIGLSVWVPKIEPVIGGVVPNGAAETAGLQPKDRILKVNNKPLEDWQAWVKVVRENANKKMYLLVKRDGDLIDISLIPKLKQSGEDSFGYIGAYQERSDKLLKEFYTVEQYGFGQSLIKAIDKTWSMSVLTVKLIGKLIVGEAGIKNISGPITIAQYAGQSASIGIDHYLYFMALISLSLGVLNLLPIPVLDGGHLLFYIVEAIKGSPVSEKVQIIGQNIGLALLGTLMVVAFYNDIMRLLQ